MNVLSLFPNFILPSEVLSYVISCLLKVAFSILGFEYQTLLMCFVFYFLLLNYYFLSVLET